MNVQPTATQNTYVIIFYVSDVGSVGCGICFGCSFQERQQEHQGVDRQSLERNLQVRGTPRNCCSTGFIFVFLFKYSNEAANSGGGMGFWVLYIWFVQIRGMIFKDYLIFNHSLTLQLLPLYIVQNIFELPSLSTYHGSFNFIGIVM